jgi:2-oxoglutarate dehydrogenase E2 component (dihydrolipoamide succinyltransferase)
MSVEVKIPTVGESISEVTISNWKKKDGDHVELDEIICELESDKATFELNANAAGTLRILVPEGESVPIGAVVCEISENGQKVKKEDLNTATQVAETGREGSSTTGNVIEMTVPAVGESITEVTISQWVKNDGDYVELDEVISEIESDKATFEITAEANGILRIVAQAGDTLEIGGLICRIEETNAKPAAAAKQDGIDPEHPKMYQPLDQGTNSYAAGHASPAASKIMAEKGITAHNVQGSGVGGRITKDDALRAQKPSASPSVSSAPAAAPSVPGGERGQRREKMTSLRKTISKRLVSVKNETAMLTTFNEVDMKPVMDLRKKYKDSFKERFDVNLGFMSFFTKAVCVALQEWPAVNAYIDGEEMVYNDFCDVSIAVSAPRGLVVPVIRNAEKMSFDQIEKEIVRLATRARENKLSIEEMTGGTFTITNGGIFGSMLSTPIINAPQSAILGMHNIVERPVAINGSVEIRPIMYLALSYDHRIIDGRESVSFLVRVKQLLEDPTRLLLGV